MPIVAAIVGAVMTGLLYWFMHGGGMSQIDGHLTARKNARRRAESEAAFRAAPIRAITDPADAAGVLMFLVALARGTPTPEQQAVIAGQLRAILTTDVDLEGHLVALRHAASQASDIEVATDHLCPMLHRRLRPTERRDLARMLDAVAKVHQGPTEAQAALIGRVMKIVDPA